MNSDNHDRKTLADGEIAIWIVDNASLHIKCVSRQGDPVELNSEEAIELCEILAAFAKRIE